MVRRGLRCTSGEAELKEGVATIRGWQTAEQDIDMATPKAQLQQWFKYLQEFQIACEQVDTDVYYLDLLKFANEVIAKDLPTTNEQNQFVISAQNATGLTVTMADISSSSTFEALLETVWNPLNRFVAAFLRFGAPLPFSAMSFTDFAKQKLSAIFPDAGMDANWSSVQKGLVSSVPAACYSAKQQKAAVDLLSKSNSTTQDLIDLISKMG